MLATICMINHDLPPHLRERSRQLERQPELPLEPPPQEELLPPPESDDPPRIPEPFLRRS